MAKILVSGLINLENTLRVDEFPITYLPVRFPFFGVGMCVSGVGYNLAKALTTLGNTVEFCSLIGRDPTSTLVRGALAAIPIADSGVISALETTPASVILYDPSGKRAIFTDLKDIQETAYPPDPFKARLQTCDLAALCNINFSRPFLAEVRKMGKPIATDLHTISDLDDPYNRDFFAAADILFMSDERLPAPPDVWAQAVMGRYPQVRILVIGMGGTGALLVERGAEPLHLAAVSTRPIVNTIGAGDALFSAFLDGYAQGLSAFKALRRAMVFASYKIGATGAADGFLTPESLEEWYQRSL